jgi:hypothetical protein
MTVTMLIEVDRQSRTMVFARLVGKLRLCQRDGVSTAVISTFGNRAASLHKSLVPRGSATPVTL